MFYWEFWLDGYRWSKNREKIEEILQLIYFIFYSPKGWNRDVKDQYYHSSIYFLYDWACFGFLILQIACFFAKMSKDPCKNWCLSVIFQFSIELWYHKICKICSNCGIELFRSYLWVSLSRMWKSAQEWLYFHDIDLKVLNKSSEFLSLVRELSCFRFRNRVSEAPRTIILEYSCKIEWFYRL
jgi:hypothetical protein